MAERGDDGGSGGGGEDAEAREAGAGGRRKSEEEMYLMLFQHVDAEKRGRVAVKHLVDYLLRIQLGTNQNQETDEVYDSHEDVSTVRYNILLLKTMLEEKSDSGAEVNIDTYTHVIRLWVKDVRDRSTQQQQRSLEVSQMSSDSEDEEGVSMTTPILQQSYTAGDQSFETSGGNSSTRSGHDSLDLLATMEDMRQENRRLHELEKQLQNDVHLNEEQLRLLQDRNDSLLADITRMQQEHNTKVDKLENENIVMSTTLKETEDRRRILQEAAERMRQELVEAQHETDRVREALEEGEEERERELQEAAQLQQRLGDKEVALEEEKENAEKLHTELSELVAAHHSLRSKFSELEEGNARLQRENEELHNATIPTGPAFSTPYRPGGPPSLHEEISRHGDLSSRVLPSPLVGVDLRYRGNSEERGREESMGSQSDPSLSFSHGNLTLDDLEQIARTSSNKFHTKTDVIVRMLSELMPSSSTATTPSPAKKMTTSINSESITTEVLTTRMTKQQLSAANLRQLVNCIKRLYKDKKQLKAQLEELQGRSSSGSRVVEEVDVGIQAAPTVQIDAANQTDIPPRTGLIGTCTRFAGRVMKAVIWFLYLFLVLLLICVIFVWIQQHSSSPCCRGNRGLTPGGMFLSLFERHVSVARSGYI